VAALVKRWLLGTHHGAVMMDHMQSYLDEFTFRFNRRRSGARGMLFYRLLQQAAATGPFPFRTLVANPKPKKTDEIRPAPPVVRRTAPPLASRDWAITSVAITGYRTRVDTPFQE